MTLAFISHPGRTLPELGDQHPESPRRLFAIEDQQLASGLEFALRRYDAPPATREQLCRADAASYVEQIFSAAPTEGIVWLEPSISFRIAGAFHVALFRGIRLGHRVAHRTDRGRILRVTYRAPANDTGAARAEHFKRALWSLLPQIYRHHLRSHVRTCPWSWYFSRSAC